MTVMMVIVMVLVIVMAGDAGDTGDGSDVLVILMGDRAIDDRDDGTDVMWFVGHPICCMVETSISGKCCFGAFFYRWAHDAP